jgi:hypothetical protein
MRRIRRPIFGVLALAGLASAVALALALVESVPASLAVHRSRTAQRSVSPALIRSFAVFRTSDGRARTAALPLPANVSAGVLAGFGLDLAQARYVTVSSDLSVWVLPGSGGACLLRADPTAAHAYGVNCDEAAETAAGQLVGTYVSPSGQVTVYGLAPDSNATVTVSFANGTSSDVPVVDNVFATTGPSAATSVSLKSVSGQAHTTTLSDADPSDPAAQ